MLTQSRVRRPMRSAVFAAGTGTQSRMPATAGSGTVVRSQHLHALETLLEERVTRLLVVRRIDPRILSEESRRVVRGAALDCRAPEQGLTHPVPDRLEPTIDLRIAAMKRRVRGRTPPGGSPGERRVAPVPGSGSASEATDASGVMRPHGAACGPRSAVGSLIHLP